MNLSALPIPLHYSARNLWVRRVTTALTAAGMALVVFVFATALMLDAGLRKTLVATGEPDNVVLTRKGSTTEVQSAIERSQAAIASTLPEVAVIGEPLVSREVVMLISLLKKDSAKMSNATIRGMDPVGLGLRRKVNITEGRMFRQGSNEIIVGKSVRGQFANVETGEQLQFGGRSWQVVGVFDAGRSGFDSEIWGDVNSLMQAFRRNAYSSVIVRLTDPAAFDSLASRFAEDPRISLAAKREADYYADQSAGLSTFIQILGLTLAGIFSVGAIIGATITMQAAVASRTAEIGTLRAIGFQRRAILAAFLAEAVLLSAIGGVAGLVMASAMQFLEFSTTNFQSFSELAFGFELSPGIAVASMAFSLAMGVAGGMVPAVRASRIEIVEALRCA